MAVRMPISPSARTSELRVNERIKESLPPRLLLQLESNRACDIGRMVNYIAAGMHLAETSKSSMRWYRAKSIYMQTFYGRSHPFDPNQLFNQADEESLFVRRFLRRTAGAARFLESSEGWVPTHSARRRAEGFFESAGFELKESSTYFNLSIPRRYHDFSIAYSGLILRFAPRSTVLGMAIEWVLWEAAYKGSSGLTAKKLSSRLQVTKSSLSAAILKLYQAGIVREIPDPDDGRAKLLSLRPEHPLYVLKRRLVEETLRTELGMWPRR